MSRGKFVAIEAMDAAGKQTQSKLLAEKLGALLISFPRYETEIGKLIKANLNQKWHASYYTHLDGTKIPINAIVRQALFTLDRYDAAPEINRALASGKNVVADRYWLSGLMYGASDLVDSGMLERVHECLPQPDVWVLLDVPVEESFRRRPERLDVYERDWEKLEGIRKSYHKLFAQRSRFVHKGRCPMAIARDKRVPWGEYDFCICDVRSWQIVDGVGTIEQVHERVMEAIK